MPLYTPPVTENTSYLPTTVDWHTNNAVTHVKDQVEQMILTSLVNV